MKKKKVLVSQIIVSELVTLNFSIKKSILAIGGQCVNK